MYWSATESTSYRENQDVHKHDHHAWLSFCGVGGTDISWTFLVWWGGGGGVNEWLKQNPVWLQQRILLKEACSCSPTAMVSSEWTGYWVWRCCKAPESLTRTCVNFRPQGKKLCTRPGLWWFFFFFKLQLPKNTRIGKPKRTLRNLWQLALRDNKKRTKLQILPRTTVIHFYFGVDLISVQAFFTQITSLPKFLLRVDGFWIHLALPKFSPYRNGEFSLYRKLYTAEIKVDYSVKNTHRKTNTDPTKVGRSKIFLSCFFFSLACGQVFENA